MTIAQALLFGAVQGATEFLPVSSSGHLAVLKTVLDLGEGPMLFDER
ncbi:MAG: undecaprenyl-diphosphate phosphatase, partial [Spirochaetia bacterium]